MRIGFAAQAEITRKFFQAGIEGYPEPFDTNPSFRRRNGWIFITFERRFWERYLKVWRWGVEWQFGPLGSWIRWTTPACYICGIKEDNHDFARCLDKHS